MKHNNILDLAIYYCLHNSSYPNGLSKEKKRAMRERAAKLQTEKGEVFLLKKERRVNKVVQTEKEQSRYYKHAIQIPLLGTMV